MHDIAAEQLIAETQKLTASNLLVVDTLLTIDRHLRPGKTSVPDPKKFEKVVKFVRETR